MLKDTPPPPDEYDDDGAIPKVVPPLPRERKLDRDLPWKSAFGWLGAGWRDLWRNPLPSLICGLLVFAVSALIVWLFYRFEIDYYLGPALAGFMVIGPLFATGLYEKSRRLENDERASVADVLFPRPRSGGQGLFLGVLLLMIFVLWIRAAVLIYALFFGLVPFPGMDEIAPMLLTTPTGWALLLVGTVIGALFAAFAFAVSVFSVPMLLEEETDAMSAMGLSIAMVWRNLPVMLCWGAIVLALFVLCALTGLIGLILIFPLLGHATWHAYRAIRKGQNERVFFQPA